MCAEIRRVSSIFILGDGYMTENKNLLRVLAGEEPPGYLGYSAGPSLSTTNDHDHKPAMAPATDFFRGTPLPGGGRVDIFGVEYTSRRVRAVWRCPPPGNISWTTSRKCADVTSGSEPEGYDWEMLAKKAVEGIDRSEDGRKNRATMSAISST
jgi:hypothetical protein